MLSIPPPKSILAQIVLQEEREIRFFGHFFKVFFRINYLKI